MVLLMIILPKLQIIASTEKHLIVFKLYITLKPCLTCRQSAFIKIEIIMGIF